MRELAVTLLLPCLVWPALAQELTARRDVSGAQNWGTENRGGDNPGDVIWDNGSWVLAGAWASQLAVNYPFNAQAADDFDLPGEPGAVTRWSISRVSWFGTYWSPYGSARFDMRVIFYADRGGGQAPTGGPGDPTGTALAMYDFAHQEVNETALDPERRHFGYLATLPCPFIAKANTKYWVVFQGIDSFPPQWGVLPTDGVRLHPLVTGFDGLQIPFWTEWDEDVAYQLYGAPIRPGDLNCDGRVDFADINPFVLALTDPAGYRLQFPDCPCLNGDANADGKVDFADINPFVALLSAP